jgi:ribonuclease inhibitor
MRVELDGSQVHNEADFHRQMTVLLDFGRHYGRNLAALRDRLSTDVERPVHLVWVDAEASRAALGSAAFDRIQRVLQATVDQDVELKRDDRFTYELA